MRNIKTVNVMFAGLLLFAAVTTFGSEMLVSGPTVTRNGDQVVIAFEVKEPVDVEVAVLDAEGKQVRHLAAGLLGAKAPEPFQRNALKQRLAWDGKDDYGKPTRGTQVRVRTGMRIGKAWLPAFQEPDEKVGNSLTPSAPQLVYHMYRILYDTGMLKRSVHLRGDPDTGSYFYRTIATWDSWHIADPVKNEATRLPSFEYMLGDMAFGTDGAVYQFYWHTLMRATRDRKPIPFSGTGSHVIKLGPQNSRELDAEGYGDGVGLVARCLGLDGKIYQFWSLPVTGYARLSVWGRDGKTEKTGVVPFARGCIGTNIRVDRRGYLYVGMNGLPEGAEQPPDAAQTSARSFTGTVIKIDIKDRWATALDPESGKIPDDPAKRAAGVVLEGSGGEYRRRGRFGHHYWRDNPRGSVVKVFVPNAEVVFPGLSWVGPYRTPQYTYAEAFDIDRFGRLFVTEAAKGQVRVLDDVGNELAVLKNQNDDFNIGWPMRIASNRDGFGFWDGVNTRIVLANLEFAESKTVSLK